MHPARFRSPPSNDMHAFLQALRSPVSVAGSDGLDLRVHPVTGRIDVVGRGFWTEAAVEQHFRDLARAADRLHAAGIAARVLVDLRAASVQTTQSAQRIGAATRRIWGPQDRIAVVVQSTLASLQISRVVDEGNHRLFGAIGEAEAWLAR